MKMYKKKFVHTIVAKINLIDKVFSSVQSIYNDFNISDDLPGQYRIEIFLK